MGTLLLFFTVAIIVSFFCSLWEAVLLSNTPSYIGRLQAEKPATGNLLARMKEDIDRPLSAILTLNTFAHTIGALGVGVQAGKMFGAHQFTLGPLSISFESVIATLMTLAILIFRNFAQTIGAIFWQNRRRSL